MDLTEGAISILLNSERQQNKDFKPVLQVTDIKLLTQTSGGGNSPDRYLVTLSDGTHTHHGMLATWRNDLVRSQRLRKGSVVQVSMFFTTVILNRRIIIILDLDMVLEKCDPIGDPKPLVLKGNASSSVNAKGSNLPLPNSEIMETMADVFKEKLAKKEASLRHTYEVEKKGREAAEQKLMANKLLCEELEVIKTNGPATLLASPPTFIETSPTEVFTEFKNFAEFEVVNRFLEPFLAEEPEKKKNKLVVRRRRFIYQNQQSQAVSSMEMDQNQQSQAVKKCLHCEITKTPQWRAGPLGPSTLCNACGVRFKSGRLFPEYRPAASPTFVPEVHSNSYKKVLQMRRTVIVNEKGNDGVVRTAAKTYVACQRDLVPVPDM